jgi:rhodanese-related sulfurtransferase
MSLLANVTTISQQTLLDKIDANTPMLILDVRTPEEFAQGRVPNAINIPHTDIKRYASQIAQAEKDGKEVIVYCRSGRRASYVEDVLQSSGMQSLQHLEGDMNAWHYNKQPIER